MIEESDKTPFQLAMNRCRTLETELEHHKSLFNEIKVDLIDRMPNSFKNCTEDNYEKVKADILRKMYATMGVEL